MFKLSAAQLALDHARQQRAADGDYHFGRKQFFLFLRRHGAQRGVDVAGEWAAQIALRLAQYGAVGRKCGKAMGE